MTTQENNWKVAEETTKCPGPFEGQKPWVVFAYEDAMNGFLEFSCITFLPESVRQAYRLDKGTVAMLVSIDEQGFVLGATYTIADLIDSLNYNLANSIP